MHGMGGLHPSIFAILIGFLFDRWSSFVERYRSVVALPEGTGGGVSNVNWQPEYTKRKPSLERKIFICLLYGYAVTDIRKMLSVPTVRIERILYRESWMLGVRKLSKRYHRQRHQFLLRQPAPILADDVGVERDSTTTCAVGGEL